MSILLDTFTVISHIASALGAELLKLLTIREIINLELSKIGYKLLKDELPTQIVESLSTDAKANDLRKTHKYSTRQK